MEILNTLALMELTELGLSVYKSILLLNMNSSEFHVLTVEHGWVVGNGEGVDMGDYMCEQFGLL